MFCFDELHFLLAVIQLGMYHSSSQSRKYKGKGGGGGGGGVFNAETFDVLI